MGRKTSILAPQWWDYTTLDDEILNDAARLTADDMAAMGREGSGSSSTTRWRISTSPRRWSTSRRGGRRRRTTPPASAAPSVRRSSSPSSRGSSTSSRSICATRTSGAWTSGICDGREVPQTHPLSFARADRELCFDRIRTDLKMPEANLHFPKADPSAYIKSWDGVRCVVMQGGQGDIKHWAFNDPVRREGKYKDRPPTPAGVPPAHHARGGPAPGDDHAERPHHRRRRGHRVPDPGDLASARCRPGRRRRSPSGRRARTTTRSACG